MALKCVYLPVRSQIDLSTFTASQLFDPLQPNDLSVTSRLVDTLIDAFPWVKDSSQEGNFSQIWNEFYDSCFPKQVNKLREPIENRSEDITVDELERRLNLLETNGDSFYQLKNFKVISYFE